MGTDNRRSIFSIYMTVIGIIGLLFDGCVANPQFDSQPQYVQFPENKSTPIGTFLFALGATDGADSSNKMTFFTIDTATNFYVNIIQLNDTSPAIANITLKNELDRESNQGGIELKFFLRDIKGNTIHKSVRLYILDVCDEPPQFDRPSYTLEIYEMNITSTLLVFSGIHATDRDLGANAIVTYRMESTYLRELYKETFKIVPENGSVYLLRSLDYENNIFYQFTLHSHDKCNLTGVPADLIVLVKDVQDRPPFFAGLPYWKSITEGNYTHEFVLQVTAIDGDLGISNPISYIFIPSDRFCKEHFVINASTGEIVVTGRLDWEMEEVKHIDGICNFIVEAKEIDKHPENQRGQTVSNVTVTVNILQTNTQSPHVESDRTTTDTIQTVTFDFGVYREMKVLSHYRVGVSKDELSIGTNHPQRAKLFGLGWTMK